MRVRQWNARRPAISDRPYHVRNRYRRVMSGTERAVDIAEQVRAGRRTPVEVVRACLDRIAASDKDIGAFQVVDAERAVASAEELGKRSDLAELPLAGVPVAIKDNVAVAGLPTRHGSGATSERAETDDDELVRRLKQAGAIVVGKTRLPELAIWGFTESLALGGTRNPRNPLRNAGGSTGGGAAAVAAGMVPLALGSDGGGSLRIPSANCGVIGFKPGLGTVPIAGGIDEHWYGCSAFGPIAANMADVAAAMDVLAGPDWAQPDTRADRTADEEADQPLKLAVALNRPTPIGGPDRVYRSSLFTAAKAARKLGHVAAAAKIPYPRSLASTWISCWHAGIAEEVERLGLPIERLEPRTQMMVRMGHIRWRRSGKDLAPVRAAMDAWRDRAAEFLAPYDVLLTPTISHPAPRIGWGARAGYRRAVVNGARATPYTQAWNVAGFAALTLPFGGGGSRQPGAVQLICAPGQEAKLIRLAAQLEASIKSTVD
jgi:amidase